MWYFGLKWYKIGDIIKACLNLAKANIALGVKNLVSDFSSTTLTLIITLPPSNPLLQSYANINLLALEQLVVHNIEISNVSI